MKCDELKVYVPQDRPYGLVPEEGGEPVEEETCYLKSDVDAVIAELKKEKEYVIENTAKVINAQEREIRHQKYKRCLAMAKWCNSEAFYAEAVENDDKRADWLGVWTDKWEKLAEKFKTN